MTILIELKSSSPTRRQKMNTARQSGSCRQLIEALGTCASPNKIKVGGASNTPQGNSAYNWLIRGGRDNEDFDDDLVAPRATCWYESRNGIYTTASHTVHTHTHKTETLSETRLSHSLTVTHKLKISYTVSKRRFHTHHFYTHCRNVLRTYWSVRADFYFIFCCSLSRTHRKYTDTHD